MSAMFAVQYIKDVIENISNYVSVFADDANLMRRVKETQVCEPLQRDLDKVCECSNRQQMQLTLGGVKKMEFGKR